MSLNIKSPMAPFWFVLPDQEGEEKPAAFKIRGLDGLQMAELQDEYSLQGDTASISGQGLLKTLTYGMSDWRNIILDGKKASFSEDMKENMTILPVVVQIQISSKIINSSDIVGKKAKN